MWTWLINICHICSHICQTYMHICEQCVIYVVMYVDSYHAKTHNMCFQTNGSRDASETIGWGYLYGTCMYHFTNVSLKCDISIVVQTTTSFVVAATFSLCFSDNWLSSCFRNDWGGYYLWTSGHIIRPPNKPWWMLWQRYDTIRYEMLF